VEFFIKEKVYEQYLILHESNGGGSGAFKKSKEEQLKSVKNWFKVIFSRLSFNQTS